MDIADIEYKRDMLSVRIMAVLFTLTIVCLLAIAVIMSMRGGKSANLWANIAGGLVVGVTILGAEAIKKWWEQIYERRPADG